MKVLHRWRKRRLLRSMRALNAWTHHDDCDWPTCRNKAAGRCCGCWGPPYCTPPAVEGGRSGGAS